MCWQWSIALVDSPSTNTAPSLGPVLGGVIAQHIGWRWIFWLLLILSGTQLLAMALLFPETARKVVGNGLAAHSSHRGIFVLYLWLQASSTTDADKRPSKCVNYWPNPLACLPIILDRNSAFVMITSGLFYTVFTCLAASLSTTCISIYKLNYLDAGLVYLPAGAGGILAAYFTGRHTSLDNCWNNITDPNISRQDPRP